MVSWVKQLKRESRNLLFGNYRVFLFATLFFTAVFFGFVFLSTSFCEILCAGSSDEVLLMVSLTMDILNLIICFPLICGYVSICTGICDGRGCELSELFRYYSRGRSITDCYAFLLRKIPEAVLEIIIPFVLLYCITEYGVKYTAGEFPDIYIALSAYIPAIVFILQVITVITVFYLSGGLLLSLIDFCYGIKQKHKASDIRRFFIMRLSFLPLCVFSVLSFGVLFIAYTLPYTIVTYSLFAIPGGIASSAQLADNGRTKIFDIPPKTNNQ